MKFLLNSTDDDYALSYYMLFTYFYGRSAERWLLIILRILKFDLETSLFLFKLRETTTTGAKNTKPKSPDDKN